MQAEDTGENMKKKKVVIITNAPAPYRVAFFQYIQEHESDYAFHIVYTSENSQIGQAVACERGGAWQPQLFGMPRADDPTGNTMTSGSFFRLESGIN